MKNGLVVVAWNLLYGLTKEINMLEFSLQFTFGEGSYIDFRLPLECTEEEYAELNNAGSADLVEQWLQELIDAKIGDNYTEII